MFKTSDNPPPHRLGQHSRGPFSTVYAIAPRISDHAVWDVFYSKPLRGLAGLGRSPQVLPGIRRGDQGTALMLQGGQVHSPVGEVDVNGERNKVAAIDLKNVNVTLFPACVKLCALHSVVCEID